MKDDCRGCRLSRREFVQDVFMVAAGALAASSLVSSQAMALPLSALAELKADGTEHSYPLPAQDGASIDRDNQVILVRYQSHVYAFALSCPHQNTALRWLEAEGRFQCPKHHSKYQPDGVFISGRATRGMDRYEVRREGDVVVVNLDKLFHDDKDPAGWLSAAIQL
jgi:nitrite reductase/ring-hydroxylating ferredoxin subunit